jgi:hypothetical protein
MSDGILISAITGEVQGELPELTPEQILEQERARMSVTRRQAFIALGPEVVSALMAYANDPETPWALRVAITETVEWHRTAPEIDEIGYALGFTGDEIDALFQTAAGL